MEKLIIICICSLAAAITFTGCVSQGEIKAEVWMNSGLPKSLCAGSPDLQKYGSYRKLNDDQCAAKGLKPGCVEFMAYCRPEYQKWISMSGARFEELLKKYLPVDSSAQ